MSILYCISIRATHDLDDLGSVRVQGSTNRILPDHSSSALRAKKAQS